MKNIIKSNDVVLISYVQSLLDDNGVGNLVFDQNISITEGSIGLFPRRIMVADDDFETATTIIKQGGLENELLTND